jgi:phosphoglycolate phosphatase
MREGVKNMKSYQYIFFDLDGTITDPEMGITNSVIYSLEHYGIEIPERTELHKFIGPPLLESYQKYYGFSPKGAKEVLAVYREYYGEKGVHENELYEGIRELLEKLYRAGKRMVLATSKPETYARIIMDDFDLSEYFYFIGGSDMAESRARKDEVIEYCFEQCEITDRSEVVMIGDREYDIRGAKKTGIDSIGVLYGYGNRQELEEAGADIICKDINELYRKLLA